MYREQWLIKPEEIPLHRDEKYVVALIGSTKPKYGIMFDRTSGKQKLYLEDDEGCVLRIKEVTYIEAPEVAREMAAYVRQMYKDAFEESESKEEEEADWEDIAYILFDALASLYIVEDEIDSLVDDLADAGMNKKEAQKLYDEWRTCVE